MKIAYFDCFAGAGGDMIAASMLDAGLDEKFLTGQIASLRIKSLKIKIQSTSRAGIRCLSFEPIASQQHHHRNLKEITQIINRSRIGEAAKETAIKIFEKLAKAEAKIHGKKTSEIHFHEIGAVDSIADIVAAAAGYQFFKSVGVERFYCSPLSVGGGTVTCAHGLLPVPAPATVELLKGVPITEGPAKFELLTPTAAAIFTTIIDRFGPLPEMKVEKIGYGAGSMQSEEFPNCLRLIIGQAAAEAADTDCVYLLETNVDDVSGELIGYVTGKLLDCGALDVFTTPIYMKHNRPAVKLSIICGMKDAEKFEEILFAEGLTLGIRKQIVQRSKLVRSFESVKTRFGNIKIKIGSLKGKVVNIKPEFSDCTTAAEKYKIPVKHVIENALKAYKERKKK